MMAKPNFETFPKILVGRGVDEEALIVVNALLSWSADLPEASHRVTLMMDMIDVWHDDPDEMPITYRVESIIADAAKRMLEREFGEKPTGILIRVISAPSWMNTLLKEDDQRPAFPFIGGPPHLVAQTEPDECIRCSVASMLGLPKEEVPNFVRDGNGRWADPFEQWLSRHGLRYSIQQIDGRHKYQPVLAKWYLATCRTSSGSYHMVVIKDGEVWHDPLNVTIEEFLEAVIIEPNEH